MKYCEITKNSSEMPNNGMSIIGVGNHLQKAVKVLALLAAVVFDSRNSSKKK